MSDLDECVSVFFTENSEISEECVSVFFTGNSQNTELVDICAEVDNIQDCFFETQNEDVIESDPDFDDVLYKICEEVENK